MKPINRLIRRFLLEMWLKQLVLVIQKGIFSAVHWYLIDM